MTRSLPRAAPGRAPSSRVFGSFSIAGWGRLASMLALALALGAQGCGPPDPLDEMRAKVAKVANKSLEIAHHLVWLEHEKDAKRARLLELGVRSTEDVKKSPEAEVAARELLRLAEDYEFYTAKKKEFDEAHLKLEAALADLERKRKIAIDEEELRKLTVSAGVAFETQFSNMETGVPPELQLDELLPKELARAPYPERKLPELPKILPDGAAPAAGETPAAGESPAADEPSTRPRRRDNDDGPLFIQRRAKTPLRNEPLSPYQK